MVDILIPTMKSLEELKPMIDNLSTLAGVEHKVFASCEKVSASTNRNICLNQATSNIVIMLDDDIEGFFDGWASSLLQPLFDKQICMVSARLFNLNGTVQNTCMDNNELLPELIVLKPEPNRIMPSAAIAFRKTELRFDENFIGSGWEDTDFCRQYWEYFKEAKFVVTNACKLIHRNEMKSQGIHWERNKNYFEKKWGIKC